MCSRPQRPPAHINNQPSPDNIKKNNNNNNTPTQHDRPHSDPQLPPPQSPHPIQSPDPGNSGRIPQRSLPNRAPSFRPSVNHPTNSTNPDNNQNSHITSLIKYLTSVRKPYLTPTPATYRRKPAPTAASASHASSSSAATQKHPDNNDTLTDPDRDAIDSSTSLLLHDLSSSLTNLSSAESLRQETHASQLRARYGRGRAGRILFRWAGGKSALPDGPGHEDEDGGGKSGEQLRDEETARVTRAVRESVLWFLRRALEGAVVRQRELVERRIERARERERSVLYKTAQESGAGAGGRPEESMPSTTTAGDPAITEAESKEIESQLSPEQLQLFAEENDSMLRYYQDTLGKVQ